MQAVFHSLVERPVMIQFLLSCWVVYCQHHLSPSVGQTTNPPHTELTTVHVNTGTPYSITASPSRLTTATGEAASRAPPQEKTSHLAVTRPSVSEATHVTSLLSELGTVSEGTRDMISLHTTTLPSTLPMFLRHHSSISPKSFSFTGTEWEWDSIVD